MTVECGNDTTQVDSCDVEFTHELMPFGPVTIPGPGVTVETEDGIDLSFEDMVYIDGSTNFGTADIMNAQPEAGDGQVLWLNNISAVYDLTGVGDVEQVKFEFFESGGIENLRINGQTLVDDIDNMGGAPSVAPMSSWPTTSHRLHRRRGHNQRPGVGGGRPGVHRQPLRHPDSRPA